MEGPDSSYSCLVNHNEWKVGCEAIIEPPSQTEYLRSGGAIIPILIVNGAELTSSLYKRSTMPGNIVLPPDTTMSA